MKKAILKTMTDNELAEAVDMHYELVSIFTKFAHVGDLCKAEHEKTIKNFDAICEEQGRREEEAWSRTHTIEFIYEKTDYSFCIQFEDDDEWFSISQYGVDFYIHHDKEYNHIVVYLDNGKYDTIVHKQAIDKSKPMK